MTPPSNQLSLGVAIPAAGAGSRLGGRPKAFVTLRGIPLLRHALQPFLDHPHVQSVGIALPSREAADPPAWLREIDDRVRIVAGGSTRLHSVQAAIEVLDPGVSWVLVHDAARPLVTRAIIDRCIEARREGEGVVVGWPVADTLKEVDGEGKVVTTPDRSCLWGAQTPQAFPLLDLANACRRGIEREVIVTDDAEVFCRFGGTVRVVEGSPWNLKVTHPEDLVVAEHLLPRLRALEGED